MELKVTFDVNVHHHYDHKIEAEIKRMAGELDNLTREVIENNDAVQSAITLLKNLSDEIASLKNDPVALQELADKLDAQSKQLADAVVANTPVEPTPPTP